MKIKSIFLILCLGIWLYSFCYADLVVPLDIDETSSNSAHLNNSEIIKYSNDKQIILKDDANLINEEKLEDLATIMEPITKYGHVMFITSNDVPYESYSAYADKTFDNKFGDESSGVLFLIDMNNRILWIHSDGDINKVITSSIADTITEEIYTYATDGDYYTTAKLAFEKINEYLLNDSKSHSSRIDVNPQPINLPQSSIKPISGASKSVKGIVDLIKMVAYSIVISIF